MIDLQALPYKTSLSRTSLNLHQQHLPGRYLGHRVAVRGADAAADGTVRILHRRLPGAPIELPRRCHPGSGRWHPVVAPVRGLTDG